MVGTRVYIGGLPYGAREKDLERFFKGYGRIRDVLIKNGYGFVEFEDYRDADDAVYELNGKELLGERVIVEAARGASHRGGGYGNSSYGYSSHQSRRRGGDRVSVEKARGAPRGSDMWRGRSGGSSGPGYGGGSGRSGGRRNNYGMDRPGVERYGPPTRTEFRLIVENLSSRVSWQDLKDYMRQAGEVTYADAHKQRRNEGVVEFATYQDMRNAIDKLDDTDLNGRRIRLVEDTRRKRRSRSSSSRSRSRSRSRGRRTRSRSRSRRSSRSRGRSSRSKSRSKSRGRSRSHSSAGKKSSSTRRRSKSRDKSPKRDSRSRSKSRSRSAEKNDKQADHKEGPEGANHDGEPEGNNHHSPSPEVKRRSASPPGARSDEDGSEDGRKGGESMEDD